MGESKTPQHTGADSPLEFLSDVDERELARVGKKSVLKVSTILGAVRLPRFEHADPDKGEESCVSLRNGIAVKRTSAPSDEERRISAHWSFVTRVNR